MPKLRPGCNFSAHGNRPTRVNRYKGKVYPLDETSANRQ